ncbi:MAG: YdgA family protein, partial [Pseudomonadales bacterium]|nr:YdgA family protein [Pseudomonadales bacterium]
MRSNTPKILAAAALLALIALAVMPKVVGVGIEGATVTNLVDLLPLEARDQITITNNRFDGGWFSSTAVMDIAYSPLVAMLGALPITAQIILDIQHGPILFTPNGLEFGLAYAQIIPKLRNVELESALSQLPFDLPSIDIGLLAGFDQFLRVGLEVAPINYSDSQGHLLFDGLSGSFVSHGDNSAEFSLSVGKLEAQENGSTIGFTLSGIELTSRTSQLNDVLAPSSAILTFPRITSDTRYPFTVEGILVESRLQTSTSGAALT